MYVVQDYLCLCQVLINDERAEETELELHPRYCNDILNLVSLQTSQCL